MIKEILRGWSVEVAATLSFLVAIEIFRRSYIVSKNKIQAFRSNISGKYIALYEDQVKEVKSLHYSELKITQKGLKIEGTNNILNSKRAVVRTWLLRGEVLHGDMMAGLYSEKTDRNSRSVGSFFLVRRENSMDFQGYWTGWDEANNKLSYGEYSFLKRPAKTSFSKMAERDGARLAALSEQAFGRKYFEFGIYSKLQKYKSAQILCARIGGRKEQAAAFSLFYMLPAAGLADFLLNGHSHPQKLQHVSDDLARSDRNGKIGVIQTICVDPEYRLHGVGRDLFSLSEKRLRKYKPSYILSPAWNVGGQMSAARLMNGLGYSPAISIDGYWRQDCDASCFSCPSRASGICICNMTLFKKEIG